MCTKKIADTENARKKHSELIISRVKEGSADCSSVLIFQNQPEDTNFATPFQPNRFFLRGRTLTVNNI